MNAKTEIYGWDAAVPESAGYINRAIRRLVRESGAREVLDAGCGNGALVRELLADGHMVAGVDGDGGGIDHARTIAPQARLAVATFDQDPKSLGLSADGLFDHVVSTEVIEHLYAPHELADFCFAALRPGGKLAISTPYHGYLKNLALSVMGKWDFHHTAHWHGGHIKFWSRQTLGALLERSGFRITGFVGTGRLPYLWKSMIVTAEKPR